ncbi:hypothetical protein C1I97_38620, partial [Streptomyces sp. NTH33]|uniref:class I SAM-dependent methyltransferase n=1 Tax=Streptomyces sp. NTH33 TaxID=1735453 RepID=UPI000DB08ACA
ARHRAPTPRTSLALDAGCGAGRNLPALLAAGYRVLAADLHPGMLDQARRHTQPGLALIQTDLARLPLRDQAASVIVCHGVLHNLPDHTLLAAALHELRRVLAPGGVLSLNTFTADYLDPCLQDLGADIYRLPNGQHMTLLDSGRLRELLRHTGLSVQGTPAQYL